MYARTVPGPEKQPLLRDFLDEPDTPPWHSSGHPPPPPPPPPRGRCWCFEEQKLEWGICIDGSHSRRSRFWFHSHLREMTTQCKRTPAAGVPLTSRLAGAEPVAKNLGGTQLWVGYGCAAWSFDHHPIQNQRRRKFPGGATYIPLHVVITDQTLSFFTQNTNMPKDWKLTLTTDLLWKKDTI